MAIVVAVIVWRQTEARCAALTAQIAEARALERAATERLIQARKDGFEVPDEPVQLKPSEDDDDTLPPALAALVEDWETPTAQAAQKAEIRRYRKRGMEYAEIARRLAPTPLEAVVN